MEKKVAIYARVSTVNQTDNTSLDDQVKACRQYASERGWEVVEEVQETWTGTDLDRPGISKLRDLAEAGAIQAVIVRDLDRLSRGSADGSMWHIGYLQEAFKRSGAPVHMVSRPRSDNDGGGEQEDDGDDIRTDFDAILAVEEKRRIRRRLKRGKLASVRAGQISGSGLVPFGYVYVPIVRRGNERVGGGYYERVEADAAHVRRMFEWVALEGLSLNAVCTRLHEMGVPTRRGGARWTPTTVRAILRNSTYAGRYVYNKTESIEPQAARRRGPAGRDRKTTARTRPESEWLYVECPAVVSEELFHAVDARLRYNQEHAARRTVHPYLLRGMLWCAECEKRGLHHKLIGHAQRGGRSKYCIRYYDCKGRFNNTKVMKEERCTAPLHNADRLEDDIWRKLVAVLSDPKTIARALSAGGTQEAHRAIERDRADIEAASAGLERARVKEARYTTAYGDGVIDLAALKKHLAAVRADATGYELQRDAAMARMTAREVAHSSRAQLEALVTRARHNLPLLPQEDRRAFLEALEFKATVDTEHKVDFDVWLTERLLPYLQPDKDEKDEVDPDKDGGQESRQHSYTKRRPALQRSDEFRVPIHVHD